MLINQLPFLVIILMPSIFHILTVDYTEIKPGQYPYLMFFEAQVRLLKTKTTGVGILVSNRAIVTDGITGYEVLNRPTFAYSGLSGVANVTNLLSRYPIQEVIYPPWYQVSFDTNGNPYQTVAQVAIVMLKDSVRFEDGLYPIKIPAKYPYTNEVNAVHVGLSVRTGILCHSKLKIIKWDICSSLYKKYNNLTPENFFSGSRLRRNVVCSDLLSLNDSTVQGPYIIKGETPRDDLLIGIHTFDFHLANKSRIPIVVDTVLYRLFMIKNSRGTLVET